jgi:hypothetical protein
MLPISEDERGTLFEGSAQSILLQPNACLNEFRRLWALPQPKLK